MSEDFTGRNCKLVRDTRFADGTIHTTKESMKILRSINQLGKPAFMVTLQNGLTSILFPDEISIDE